MKAVILFFGILFSVDAYSGDFYFCENIGHKEYRATVDLSSNAASFFDNNSYSSLYLISHRKNVLLFEGKDSSYNGVLRMEFDLRKKKLALYNIDGMGESFFIGQAKCREDNSPAFRE